MMASIGTDRNGSRAVINNTIILLLSLYIVLILYSEDLRRGEKGGFKFRVIASERLVMTALGGLLLEYH